MIRVENIKKQFGDQKVLKGITTVFEQGKANLIIGKSGAGKTVLLKILVGLLQPTSGTVWYGDTNFTKLTAKQRKAIRTEMGMLFQGSALFDSMTVEENVRFPLDMFTNDTRKEKKMRVDRVLERVELSGTNKKYPSETSGGMQKRIGIARSIILEPKFLFCDEPNSGLDPTTAIRIDELIRNLTVEKQITTVINTHDMNSVMEIGDKINLLYFGELAWVGNRLDVMASDNDTLQDFIFASPFLQRLRDAAQKNGNLDLTRSSAAATQKKATDDSTVVENLNPDKTIDLKKDTSGEEQAPQKTVKQDDDSKNVRKSKKSRKNKRK